MEPDRPFKHVEVIDARNSTSCKVACMACIRGHRATSCGSASCRQKVFWTVKRPGRPSNSCSCRFGSRGACKCNLAQNSCPHRVKGAKRSVDCRCQEQGRFCCYLDAHQWEEMYALRKPRVTLFASREELDVAHAKAVDATAPSASVPPGVSPTPSLVASSHQTMSSLPSTPERTMAMRGSTGVRSDLDPTIPQSSDRNKAVRLNMMGVGGPYGSDTTTPLDALQWQGLAPEMPADFDAFDQLSPLVHDVTPSNPPHTTTAHLHQQHMPSPYPYADDLAQAHFMPPITNALQQMHMVPHQVLTPDPEPSNAYEIDKLMADYVHYQFPSAICQKCGLNGCTCRNCPPVMQNAGDGSWGQGCKRRHFDLTRPNAGTIVGGDHTVQIDAGAGPSSSGCCSFSGNATPQTHQQLAAHNIGVGAGQQHHEQDFAMPMDDPMFDTQGFRMHDFEISSAETLHQAGGCCGGGGESSTDISEMLMDDLQSANSGCCYSGQSGNGG